jgi:hypothetical protein
VVIVLLVGLYVRFVWDQLWIVKWIPLPSVIILANWFPLLLGALAGILWKRMQKQPMARRLPMQAVLMAATVLSEIHVLPRNVPQCKDEWIEKTDLTPYRICRQTTLHTCSAAAAATILTALGQQTTEAEMARLCLTREGTDWLGLKREGTTWLGLYHGLSIRLRGSGFKVEFFQGTVEDLGAVTREFPALLCCELTPDVDASFPVYQNDRGWVPGVAHSTVLLYHAPPVYFIGDPSQFEPEYWSQQDVWNLWTGTGLRVVRTGETQTDSTRPASQQL